MFFSEFCLIVIIIIPLLMYYIILFLFYFRIILFLPVFVIWHGVRGKYIFTIT